MVRLVPFWGTIFLSKLLSNYNLSKVTKMGNRLEDVIRIVTKNLGKFGLMHINRLKFC